MLQLTSAMATLSSYQLGCLSRMVGYLVEILFYIYVQAV